MTINATASTLLLLYQLVGEEQGVRRRPTARHDPERHLEGVRGARHVHLPAAPVDAPRRRHLRLLRQGDAQWNTISISGYHIREAGSTAVQEIAFTLANGIAYVEAALAAGLA
jgi:methylmalonyl-CoA mutase N-terminal domain/subunit